MLVTSNIIIAVTTGIMVSTGLSTNMVIKVAIMVITVLIICGMLWLII